MRVRDLMTTTVVDVLPETSIWGAIQIMLGHKVSGVPVVDRNGTLVGVLSEGDLLRRAELGTTRQAESWFEKLFAKGGSAEAYRLAHARHVGDIMSRPPVTVAADDTLSDAVALMERHRVKRLPVIDQGRLVGMVSRADFLRALGPLVAPSYEEPATSDAEIEATIVAQLGDQPWATMASVRPVAHNGHVELHGTIAREEQRAAVRVLAEGVIGVSSVEDHLAVVDATYLMSA